MIRSNSSRFVPNIPGLPIPYLWCALLEKCEAPLPKAAIFGKVIQLAITAGRERSAQTKQAFYHRLAVLLKEQLGIRSEDVMVVMTTTQLDEWSFGNGLVTLMQNKVIS